METKCNFLSLAALTSEQEQTTVVQVTTILVRIHLAESSIHLCRVNEVNKIFAH